MNASNSGSVESLPEPPLDDETRKAFYHCLSSMDRVLAGLQKKDFFPLEQQENLFELLQTLALQNLRKVPAIDLYGGPEVWRPLHEFLERPEIRLNHFVRLMVLLSTIRRDPDVTDAYLLDFRFEPLLHHYRQSHPFSLRDLGNAFSAVGLDAGIPGRCQLRAWE